MFILTRLYNGSIRYWTGSRWHFNRGVAAQFSSRETAALRSLELEQQTNDPLFSDIAISEA